jgi:hypothetical protein
MSNNEIRQFKLENLIREAVTLALFEQKLHENDPNQVQMPQQNAGPVPPPPQPTDPNLDPPPPDPNQQQQQQPLTVDSMIERLNVIRGGRSFTDPEIYGQFVTFFKRLTPEQTQVIDQFLQDISKVVMNVEQQQEAPPQQAPAPPAQQNNAGIQAPIAPNAGASPPAGAAGGGSMPGM